MQINQGNHSLISLYFSDIRCEKNSTILFYSIGNTYEGQNLQEPIEGVLEKRQKWFHSQLAMRWKIRKYPESDTT